MWNPFASLGRPRPSPQVARSLAMEAFANKAGAEEAASRGARAASSGAGAPFRSIQLPGMHYRDVIGHLHRSLAPKTYLEIGVNAGDTLALASCPAIAIDPNLAEVQPVVRARPSITFYEGTSDSFFREHATDRLPCGPVDFAFIDGMHLVEYVLRDLINVERSCTTSSLVALHDCVPCDPYVASRDPYGGLNSPSSNPNWWTGDVWKMVPILKQHRPDLQVTVLDAGPTGILLIRNLDPRSTILADRYERIVGEMIPPTLEDYGFDRLLAECRLESSVAYVENLPSVHH